jgi:hypothetical protein
LAGKKLLSSDRSCTTVRKNFQSLIWSST